LSGPSSLSPADARSDAALWVGVPADAPVADLPDQVRVVHADDPVSVWSPRLLPGPTPQWRGSWFPMVSFWQATADLAAAYDIPNGHGHRYAGEPAAAVPNYTDGSGSAANSRNELARSVARLPAAQTGAVWSGWFEPTRTVPLALSATSR
jgi:uncharacterized membrane protein